MQSRASILFCGLAVAACGKPAERAAQPDAPPPSPEPSFSRLDPSALLGEGWHPAMQLIVRDWQQLEELGPTERVTADLLRTSMEGQGVTSVAELSWSRKQMPIDQLSVRVFAFADAAKLTAWRAAKYGGLRAKSLKLVEDAGYEAYDVMAEGKRKRIAFFDRIYVSSHQLRDGGDHVVALEEVCRQMLTAN